MIKTKRPRIGINWIRGILGSTLVIVVVIVERILDKIVSWGNLNLEILLAFLLVLAPVIIALSLKYKEIKVRMTPPFPIRTKEEEDANSRKGLIIFLSLYHPIRGMAKKLTKDEKIEAAKNYDYEKLDIENSNLETTVRAILMHRKNLEHCWFIGTKSDVEESSSILYEDVLIKYLEDKYGIKRELFHKGDKYAIPLHDDSAVYEKTYRLVRSIYSKAKKEFNLKPCDIIADFTGAPRSMALGMILSCLNNDRDIQFMGVKYDSESNPIGKPFPIIFNFETKVFET